MNPIDEPIGQIDTAEVEQPSADSIPSVTPPKRKRGRPRKIVVEEELSKQRENKQTVGGQEILVAQGTAWDALENPERYVLPPKKQGYASQAAKIIRSDAPREQIIVRVRSELKRAAQVLAAAQNLTLGDIIEQSLVRYIQENRNSLKSKEEE